ncbi:TonB family protein [Pseudomonas lurida]|uniref:TonB family protein n=1 Tax=Pseudomonas lurida TaxID=244566 RepID=UPI000BF699CA|nr:TonB family protein [Pseudomonas lurida]PFG21484.1 TonB family protein [Pseudomonas lurida]
MRFFVLAAALLLSTSVMAQFVPEVVTMPKPLYPGHLITTQGHARISLNIHNDGTVSDVKALSATKPAFGEAAVAAATLWRFKPWTVDAERPAVLEAQNDMVFTPEPVRKETTHLTFTQTTYQTCSALTEEVSQFRREHPTRPLIAMKSFAITRVAVMFPALSGKSDYNEGLARADELENALPDIVRKCQAHPKATYADYLPRNVKGYL